MTTPAAAGPSFVRAAVTGAATETYVGTGDFTSGGDQFGGHVRTFFLNSVQGDSASSRSFTLWQQGAGTPPAVGTYAVAVPDYARPTWPGPAFGYWRYAGGVAEGYLGVAGEVTVIESSATRVRGRFHITARRYCWRTSGPVTPESQQGSCMPRNVPADAPALELTGEFSATPYSGAVQTLPARP